MTTIDLHRHVGGSISAETVSQISGLDLSMVESKMRFQPGEKKTFANFLNKFRILDTLKWNEDNLRLAICQVVQDIVRSGLSYVELKFTIDKYVNPDWPPAKVLEWIILSNARPDKVALILSLKYEASHQKQQEVAKLIENEELMKHIVGIDLVGEESFFDAGFYAEILAPWRKAGKGIEAHVGETGPVENVVDAIEKIGVKRIAHGIAAAGHPDVMRLANKKNICFDIALTSNYYTGVADFSGHPVLRMAEAGCNITIGTDDPYILNTNLGKEYLLLRNMGLQKEQYDRIRANPPKYAFTKI